MRKLVTIRKVTGLIPIEGADNIQIGVIDSGWQVIVKKGEFKVGDFCLFYEIDSFLPMEPQYSFMKPTTYNGKEGYRLRSLKLRGALSQGLALPLSMFNEFKDYDSLDIETAYYEKTDFSEKLGVIKYDNQQIAGSGGGLKAGNQEGKFPSFIPKTDQERIQNLTSWFSTKTDDLFEETLKLDGSSMTCYKIKHNLTFFDKVKKFFGLSVKDYKFGVCSRNLELRRPKDSADKQSDFWSTAIKLEIESKIPAGFAIQGELIGPKIQANHEKVQELQYYVFDVYDIYKGQYLLPSDRHKFCFENDIRHVPVLGVTSPLKMNLQELLKHVEGQSINPGTISEGRVYKSTTQAGVSFKVISNKYLLRSEK